jgi:proteic killer suppression protein
MIRSYKDKKTQRFAAGERVPQFASFRQQAEKRLRVLEAATGLRDLAQLPGNRLEALAGDRAGQYRVLTTLARFPPLRMVTNFTIAI